MHHNNSVCSVLPGDLYVDDITKIWKTPHAILQLNSSPDRSSLISFFFFFFLFLYFNTKKYKLILIWIENTKQQDNGWHWNENARYYIGVQLKFFISNLWHIQHLKKKSNWILSQSFGEYLHLQLYVRACVRVCSCIW